MTKTVTQILDSALKSIGAIEPDDTVGSTGSTEAQSYATDALEQLNDLLSLCSAESLMIPALTRKAITVSSQAFQFTMTERPLHVEGICYVDSDGEQWLDRMDSDEFEAIVDKTVVSTPCRFFYNASFPAGTMYFDCTVAAGSQFVLVYLAPFTSVAALTDSVSVPDEYYPYLRSETAIMCCAYFGLPIPASVARLAMRARRTIRRRAGLLRIRELTVDYGIPSVSRGRINILDEA